MNSILLIILITYQTIVSVMDMGDIKKFKGIEITEKIRLDFYKEAIIWGWIPVWIIGLFIAFSPLSLGDVGLREITLSNSMLWNSIVFIITGVMMLSLLYQTIMYFISEEFRRKNAIEFNNRKNSNHHYDNVVLNLLVPHTLKEKIHFFFVSLTAGICEEMHLRGCVMFLLADIFPDLHIVVIGLIASLLFGVFHCYQGVFGVIKTSMAGMFFATLYIVTDSVIPGIILHFCMDFSSAFIIDMKRTS